MPVLVEHNIAAFVDPTRLGAQLAATARDFDRVADAEGARVLGEAAKAQRRIAEEVSSVVAAQMVASLRRVRHLRITPETEEAIPLAMLVDAAAATAEGFRSLDEARQASEQAGQTQIAEGLTGRHGELAVELSQWTSLLWEMAGGDGVPGWPTRIDCGPRSVDPRIRGPVGLITTSAFLVSATMSIRLVLVDAEINGFAHSDLPELSGLAARLLSWGQELAAGAVMLIEELVDQEGRANPATRSALDSHEAARLSAAGSVAAAVLMRKNARSSTNAISEDGDKGLEQLIETLEGHARLATLLR